MQEIEITEKVEGRIDSYLAPILSMSRSKVAKMLKEKCILVNEKEVKASYELQIGDKITIEEYVEEYLMLNPKILTFHIESSKEEKRTKKIIDEIKRAGTKVGIAISPETDISKIEKLEVREEVKREINEFLDRYYDRHRSIFKK